MDYRELPGPYVNLIRAMARRIAAYEEDEGYYPEDSHVTNEEIERVIAEISEKANRGVKV